MSTLLAKKISDLLNTKENFTLIKLMGEASYREYYRAQFEGGKSLIIMKMPAGLSSASEEISKTTFKTEEPPFINVQKYLKKLSLPVPSIIATDLSEGIIVLQDLGDQSFERELLSHDRKNWVEIYEKAITLLGLFQQKTSQNPEANCIGFHRQFDEDLLNWELHHFLEYGVTDRLSLKIDPADDEKFQNIFKRIVREIVEMPQTLVHRDFQSRNMIVYQGQFYLIDFQDALIGPVLYDMVALLRDSYIELDAGQRETLLKFYQQQTLFDVYKDFDLLQRHFDLITLQRKLKDAGRFQYIKTVKGNPRFMVHFPSSIKYVKEALTHLKDFDDLGSLLNKYVPDYI